MTAARRGRGRGARRFILFLAALAAISVVLWYMERTHIIDETAKGRELDAWISSWATRNELLQEDQASSVEVRQNESRRWLVVVRTLWHGPRTSRTRLSRELEAFAASDGLGYRRERGAGGTLVFEMDYPDGREAVNITLGRQVFIAIVMDDIGYQMDIARRIAALPCRLTMSVLPFTPHARGAAALAIASGKEVLVHMPVEPNYRLAKVPEYSIALMRGQSPEVVEANVRKAIDAVPGAVGMNNHEGSVGTEDRALMDAVMVVLKERHLLFLDSWTSPRTEGTRAASAAGLRWARRNVFLDSEHTPEGVNKAFDRVVHIARIYGRAVAIGHPKQVTVDMLERRIPAAQAEGVRFVFVTALGRR